MTQRFFFENNVWHENWYGPKRVIALKVHKPEETSCALCLHRVVCGQDMSKRCQNYECGGSDGKFGTCQSCVWRHRRWDDKSPVACFQCQEFLADPKLRFRVYFDTNLDSPGEALAFDGTLVTVQILKDQTYEPLDVIEVPVTDLTILYRLDLRPVPQAFLDALPKEVA